VVDECVVVVGFSVIGAVAAVSVASVVVTVVPSALAPPSETERPSFNSTVWVSCFPHPPRARRATAMTRLRMVELFTRLL
jgi:hypothetical protein